jgi:diguanylate cyclase (GGDEF)-like protein/PAS domain S-box-containing protein
MHAEERPAPWPVFGALGDALQSLGERLAPVTGLLWDLALGSRQGRDVRERRVLSLIDDCPLLMMVVDRRERIVQVSRFGASRLGYAAGALRHQRIASLYSGEHRDAVRARLAQLLAPAGSASAGGPGVFTWEAEMRHADGQALWVRHSARLFRDGEVLLVCEDVTELHQLAERLRHDAAHDALTGLANRREFERQLGELEAPLQAGTTSACLALIDIDHFKAVNDTGGHAAGDAYLRQLARVLAAVLPGTDTLARLGGDEFAVILRHCQRPQAMKIAERLRQAAGELHFGWDGRSLNTSVSIGVCAIEPGVPLPAVLARADGACYAAKRGGRDQVAAPAPAGHDSPA